MTGDMKSNRLLIAAETATAGYEQVRSIITTAEHVEELGEILIALQTVIQKAPVLAAIFRAEDSLRTQ